MLHFIKSTVKPFSSANTYLVPSPITSWSSTIKISIKPNAPYIVHQVKIAGIFFSTLVNFIIRIYSQSGTICSFVEPFLTTYSTESSDFGHYEIHSLVYLYLI